MLFIWRHLPKQQPEPPGLVPDEYAFLTEENVVPPLSGTVYEAVETLMVGMDVCVYTKEMNDRPWLGRIVSLSPSTNEFELQWYEVGITSIVAPYDSPNYVVHKQFESISLDTNFQFKKYWRKKIIDFKVKYYLNQY